MSNEKKIGELLIYREIQNFPLNSHRNQKKTTHIILQTIYLLSSTNNISVVSEF